MLFLFEKYGLHAFKNSLELQSTLVFSKYCNLSFLFRFSTRFRCRLNLTCITWHGKKASRESWNLKTVKQCKNKISNLKHFYTKAKYNNKRTGAFPCFAAFYEIFDEVLGQRSFTNISNAMQVGVKSSWIHSGNINDNLGNDNVESKYICLAVFKSNIYKTWVNEKRLFAFSLQR